MASRFCPQCGSEQKDTAKFCTQCGAAAGPAETDRPMQARDLRTAPPAKDPMPKARYLIGGLFAAILFILVFIFYNYLTIEEHGVFARQPTVGDGRSYAERTVEMVDIPSRISDGYLVFSLDQVFEHELVRVEYQSPTATIPVLSYISPHGKLVTAISISEPCNATYFTIIDGAIKCNNCNARWEVGTMQALSCCPNNYPDPIASEVIGNEVRISLTTLEEWRRRL
jgi:uncharacterized protein